MAHRIEVIKESEVIKVTYYQSITLNERIGCVHELCTDFNIFERFKLLIDSRDVRQEMTDFEQAIFGRYISSKSELSNASVAVLDNIEQPADQIFSEEASKMGYQIQQFDSMEKALAWLNR